MRMRSIKRRFTRRREPRVSAKNTRLRFLLRQLHLPFTLPFRLRTQKLAQICSLHVHHSTSHPSHVPFSFLFFKRHDPSRLRASHHRHVDHLLEQIVRSLAVLRAPRRV